MSLRLQIAVADACLLIAAFNRRDNDHDDAMAILDSVGTIVVSPLVLAEVDHALCKKVGEREAVEAVQLLYEKERDGVLLIPKVGADLIAEALASILHEGPSAC
ncbi:PIN domain-containing protein [Streptomyces sp. NPDC002928]|uniref:PIN domain-containing protein n=1 Tax=Streptomyces sp. NPDC002928 TaxID=3154440 RepID=UPI00339E5CA2